MNNRFDSNHFVVCQFREFAFAALAAQFAFIQADKPDEILHHPVRSPLGVAETGSVVLSERELHINTIGFLAHDIVILLDPAKIVENLHDAYTHAHFLDKAYSLLMSGPSGSADIGGVSVHPAQGVMTLTVIFWPDAEEPRASQAKS